MNTRDIANEYRLSHWTQVMQDRTARGLTIHAYCEETDIHENTYFYWQKKLREAVCSGVQETPSKSKNSLLPSGWTQLEAVEADCTEGAVMIEVGGCRIIAKAETDMELLTKVCRALRST